EPVLLTNKRTGSLLEGLIRCTWDNPFFKVGSDDSPNGRGAFHPGCRTTRRRNASWCCASDTRFATAAPDDAVLQQIADGRFSLLLLPSGAESRAPAALHRNSGYIASG